MIFPVQDAATATSDVTLMWIESCGEFGIKKKVDPNNETFIKSCALN